MKHALRIASVAISHPFEFADRVRSQIEIRHDRGRPTPDIDDAGDAAVELHRMLGAPADCAECADFERIWSATERSVLGSGFVLGKGHDAGIALARLCFGAARHLRPNVVVETGVARGITSRVILEALDRNERGRLWSVDLPPLSTGWHRQWATAVPSRLRPRWTYLRGASRRILPRVFDRIVTVPLFVHDSLHTYENMTSELRIAWRHLDIGGLIICDDIDNNNAFFDFAAGCPNTEWVVVDEPRRSGFVGVLRKI